MWSFGPYLVPGQGASARLGLRSCQRSEVARGLRSLGGRRSLSTGASGGEFTELPKALKGGIALKQQGGVLVLVYWALQKWPQFDGSIGP